MEQVKVMKPEAKKNNRSKSNSFKQASAILAALSMSALMMLSMLAIGGSAYLNSHTASALTQTVAAFISLI